MNNLKHIALSAFWVLFPLLSTAQVGFVHKQSTEYEKPTDSQVLNKLDKWQDMKFGVLMHWGIYSVPGIVESWSICSEDEDWIPRDSTITYSDYKKWYFGLSQKFNPSKFDPTQWADVMKNAGMKYMVFTTKHHDGFCLFDSKYTDFSIAKGPFKDNLKADALKYVFDSFRKDNFMIGAYFSKPDWHSQDYWWDYYATPNRNVNYVIGQHPQKWEQFKTYVYNQIDEIMSRYGSVDILWLDGGWVAPENHGQDIDMPKIATMARSKQPGLLIVDRTIHGKYENYQTPEQTIPAVQLQNPWESGITLTDNWGWVKNPHYKTPEKIISILMEVVAKGGNLLLGVGPTPEGLIDQPAVERLQQIGQWMKKYGNAIYNTRITPIYHSNDVWFTANKNKKTLYALYSLPEGKSVPAIIEWEGNIPTKHSKIKLVDSGKSVKWKATGNKVQVFMPKSYIGSTESLALEFNH